MSSTKPFEDESRDDILEKSPEEQDWLRAEQEEQQWLRVEQGAFITEQKRIPHFVIGSGVALADGIYSAPEDLEN